MFEHVGQLVYYISKYFLYLYGTQIVLQGVIIVVKEYYLNFVFKDVQGRGPLGIPFIREGGQLLGLTGDNSPKKRIVEHTAWKTYTLPLLSFLLFFSFDLLQPLWISLLLSLLVALLQRLTGIFFLFKFYTGQGKGLGVNLYWQGWRVIGLDIHGWQLRQHPVTGKPLGKDEQFFGPARPHIDVPNWNLHHWPWEQHNDHETMEELKREAALKREEKLVRKMAKKEERAEKVRQRTLAKEAKEEKGGEGDKIEVVKEDDTKEEDTLDSSLLFDS